MIDDSFLRAMIAGVGAAVVAGPLGCFIVWRRMAYFGGAMAHSALFGVALGFLLDINLTVGVTAATITVAVALVASRTSRGCPATPCSAFSPMGRWRWG